MNAAVLSIEAIGLWGGRIYWFWTFGAPIFSSAAALPFKMAGHVALSSKTGVVSREIVVVVDVISGNWRGDFSREDLQTDFPAGKIGHIWALSAFWTFKELTENSQ